VGEWFEPDLDEVIANLEWAYCHREALDSIGTQNAARIARYPLAKAAEQYLSHLTSQGDHCHAIAG